MHSHIVAALALVLAQAVQPAPARPVSGDTKDPLQVQVMLDRAGFSPGAIDGLMGTNTRKALDAYRHAANPSAVPFEATASYHVTEQDAGGPFTPDIPPDLEAQSKLPSLGYASLLEMLAERFHCTPALLQRLNPGAAFTAGEDIKVPNVEALVLPAPAPKVAAKKPAEQVQAESAAARARPAAKPDVTVTVRKGSSDLTVADSGGRTIFYAPVTTGSEHDPLPIGEWKVTGVEMNPPFRYNPALFWDADQSHAKAVIPPGPNNPVGVVWIDLSKEHYGMHGTPEPATIGRSESHGCVRLTNWDALKVASLVKPGTRVIFEE